jgi:hypothetical protein
MNSLWDIRIFLGLVSKESSCTFAREYDMSGMHVYATLQKHFDLDNA